MSYDRVGTGRWAWLKSVGSADEPLENGWQEKWRYLLKAVWFPKHPRSIRKGDLLVYYAAGRGRLPAVVEVTGDEVQESRDHPRYSERWPWRMEVRPRLIAPDLEDAPSLEEVGIDPLRVRRQSHILLDTDELEAVRRAFVPEVDAEGPVTA
jgi:hypothetical protein